MRVLVWRYFVGGVQCSGISRPNAFGGRIAFDSALLSIYPLSCLSIILLCLRFLHDYQLIWLWKQALPTSKVAIAIKCVSKVTFRTFTAAGRKSQLGPQHRCLLAPQR